LLATLDIVNFGLTRGFLQSNLDFRAMIACTYPTLLALMALLYEISLSLKLDSEMSQEVSDMFIRINQVDVKWGISQFYWPYH
jgi:hypothetical protein